MLLRYLVNLTILVFLLVYTFCYQADRNRERVDSRFELASHIFGAKNKASGSLKEDIETVEEFLTTFEGVIHGYYEAAKSSTGTYMHYVYGKQNLSVVEPLLKVTYHEGSYESAEYTSVATEYFNISKEDPLRPFRDLRSWTTISENCEPVPGTNSTKYLPCRNSLYSEFFDRLISMKLSFSLYSLMRTQGGLPHPRMWLVEFVFRFFSYRSLMVMEVSLDDIDSQGPQYIPVVICSILLPLVMLGFLLRIRTFSCFFIPFRRIICSKEKFLEESCLLSREKSDLCPEGCWRYIGFFSDILVLTFSVLALSSQFLSSSNSSLEQGVTILLGFSTLFCCIQLVSILVLFPSAYVVVDAIVTAGRQLSMYAVAIFPILLGYSFCGFIMFGSYGGYFGTLPLSMVSLICANFGDNLIDTFIEVDQSPFIVQLIFSRVFFATFLLFFICNVLNIAHSIIQDSYFYAVRTVSTRLQQDEEKRVLNVPSDELLRIISKFRA